MINQVNQDNISRISKLIANGSRSIAFDHASLAIEADGVYYVLNNIDPREGLSVHVSSSFPINHWNTVDVSLKHWIANRGSVLFDLRLAKPLYSLPRDINVALGLLLSFIEEGLPRNRKD